MLAAQEGHAEFVTLLLRSGAEVDKPLQNGWTALFSAAHRGCVEIGRILIDADASMNRSLHDGATPMMYASNADFVKLLHEEGADTSTVRKNGNTALWEVTVGGDVEVVRVLLESNVDVDRVNSDGFSPLMFAAKEGRSRLVELLLEHGAQVDKQSPDGWAALHFAAFKGHLKTCSVLLQHGASARQDQDENGVVPLILASQEGHNEVVDLLLGERFDVDECRLNQWRALHSAVFMGHKKIARALLRADADVNLADINGSSPLIIAAQGDCMDIMEALVEQGAIINAQSNDGTTALILASLLGRVETVKFLIGNGADVNMIDESGKTALMVAAEKSRTSVVRVLLDSKADMDANSNDCKTALMMASCCGHAAIVAELLKCGAGGIADSEGWTPMIGAANGGHVNVMLLLLEKGLQDINTHDKMENSPLLHAAFGGNVDAARLLLDHEAPVDKQNRFGWTPLAAAVHLGHRELTDLLVKCNGDINGKLLDGRSPLHLAAEGGHVELSRILLDRGAGVDSADSGRRTPLMRAAYNGDGESVRLLLENNADACLFDLQGRRAADIARENNRYDIASMIEAHMPELSVLSSADRGARQNADLLIEQREIRRYEEPFAGGSFGEVYRGKWLDADVVIKRVKAFTEDDKKAFWREARIWKKAKHPHIVPFFGAYHRAPNYFLVSKEATNGNLSDYLKRERMQSGKKQPVWQKLYEAASGLHFLHQRNIVHSDLKCNQILVGENGEAMLTDFGMSFISDESRPSGGAKGAFRWKAPECLRVETPSHPTKEADVYSFGMCVVEAVTGRAPWGNVLDSVIMYHLAHEKFLKKPNEFSDEQWRFVESLCAFDPAKRPTVEVAMVALKEFARQERKGEGQEKFIFEAQPESELENSYFSDDENI